MHSRLQASIYRSYVHNMRNLMCFATFDIWIWSWSWKPRMYRKQQQQICVIIKYSDFQRSIVWEWNDIAIAMRYECTTLPNITLNYICFIVFLFFYFLLCFGWKVRGWKIFVESVMLLDLFEAKPPYLVECNRKKNDFNPFMKMIAMILNITSVLFSNWIWSWIEVALFRNVVDNRCNIHLNCHFSRTTFVQKKNQIRSDLMGDIYYDKYM